MDPFAKIAGIYATQRLAVMSITRTVYSVVLWFMALCGVGLWVAVALHAYGARDPIRPSGDDTDEEFALPEIRQAARDHDILARDI